MTVHVAGIPVAKSSLRVTPLRSAMTSPTICWKVAGQLPSLETMSTWNSTVWPHISVSVSCAMTCGGWVVRRDSRIQVSDGRGVVEHHDAGGDRGDVHDGAGHRVGAVVLHVRLNSICSPTSQRLVAETRGAGRSRHRPRADATRNCATGPHCWASKVRIRVQSTSWPWSAPASSVTSSVQFPADVQVVQRGQRALRLEAPREGSGAAGDRGRGLVVEDRVDEVRSPVPPLSLVSSTRVSSGPIRKMSRSPVVGVGRCSGGRRRPEPPRPRRR